MADKMDEHGTGGPAGWIGDAIRRGREQVVPSTSTEPGWSAIGAGLSRYIWLLWVIWLLFLFYPLQALFHTHPHPIRAAVVLTAVALFVAVYIGNILRVLRRLRTGEPGRSTWPALAFLAVLALGLVLSGGRDWIELLIFVAVSMGPSLPPRQALAAIAAILLLMPVLGVVIHAGAITVVPIMFQTAVSSVAVVVVAQTIVLSRKLREARGEIARMAINEERLRFARDLHDLLGHSLSLIALKSELAAKLATADPVRAAAEMRDVESAARGALQEVRDAVAGYRQPALAGELENAREVLSAAGIAIDLQGEIHDLPAPREAALAWAVREGVTNVVKHSRARHCTIALSSRDGSTGLEVWDDGHGTAGPCAGSGLAGLKERLANLGGWCEAGPAPEGGFRLAVGLPVEDVRSA